MIPGYRKIDGSKTTPNDLGHNYVAVIDIVCLSAVKSFDEALIALHQQLIRIDHFVLNIFDLKGSGKSYTTLKRKHFITIFKNKEAKTFEYSREIYAQPTINSYNSFGID